jgi:hypothetical protein
MDPVETVEAVVEDDPHPRPVKGKRPTAPKKKTEGPAESTALVPVGAEGLIAMAINKGLPLESMERLLAMRRELKAEQAKEAYFADLSRFQSQCPAIIKTREVKDGNGDLRYRFAPIDAIVKAIQKPLEDCGFSYTIKTRQDATSVTAICEAHHREGHTEVTEFTIPIDPKAYMNAAQKVASALTYAKRYALCDAFGIVSADEDDDSVASGKPGTARTAPRRHAEPVAHPAEEPEAPPEDPPEDPPPPPRPKKRPDDQQEVIDEIIALTQARVTSDGERISIRNRIHEAKTVEALVRIKDDLTQKKTPEERMVALAKEIGTLSQDLPTAGEYAKRCLAAKTPDDMYVIYRELMEKVAAPRGGSTRERDMQKLADMKAGGGNGASKEKPTSAGTVQGALIPDAGEYGD